MDPPKEPETAEVDIFWKGWFPSSVCCLLTADGLLCSFDCWLFVADFPVMASFAFMLDLTLQFKFLYMLYVSLQDTLFEQKKGLTQISDLILHCCWFIPRNSTFNLNKIALLFDKRVKETHKSSYSIHGPTPPPPIFWLMDWIWI